MVPLHNNHPSEDAFAQQQQKNAFNVCTCFVSAAFPTAECDINNNDSTKLKRRVIRPQQMACITCTYDYTVRIVHMVCMRSKSMRICDMYVL